MDYKNLPIFYFLMVVFSRHLTLKRSPGLLCLLVDSSEILATKRKNKRNEKEQLTTETNAGNYLKESKKISKDQEYKKQEEHKRYVETLKCTLAVMMLLVLFINWWFIGFRFLYVYGVFGLVFFFIVKAAENTD